MSDIRINALTTTAASSASDDYLPIDGSANGTRKLSAYSPTFGGNLTVSGGSIGVGGAVGSYLDILQGGNDAYLYNRRAGPLIFGTNNTTALTLSSAQNATLAGNLTVSGTGTSSVGGNLTVSGTTGITATDLIIGSSGPSVKSTLSARAPRQGLVFDGTAVTTSWAGNVLGTGDFTASAWIYIREQPAASQIKDIFSSTGGSAFALRMNTYGGFFFDVASTYSGGTNLIDATPYIGKWAHVVYSRSYSGTTTFYVNGVSAATRSPNDTTNYSGTTNTIGTNAFPGTIAGPLLYNRALSAAEVVALYEAGAPSGSDYGSATWPASNSSLITGDNSTFASNTGFWSLGGGTTIASNALNLAAGGTAGRYALLPNSAGKKFRIKGFISAATGGIQISNNVTASIDLTNAGFTGSFDTIITWGNENVGQFTLVGNLGTVTLEYLEIYSLGLLLAPDAAQAGGGLVWYDTSGNAANITLPASGVSWNVPTSGNIAANANQNVTITTSGTGRLVVPKETTSATDYTAIFGASLGSSTGSNRVKVGLGNVDGNSEISLGQSGTANVLLGWMYNATAGDAYGFLGSYAGNNKLVLQQDGGNVLIGTTTDSGYKLRVIGSIASDDIITMLKSGGNSTNVDGNFGQVIARTNTGNIGFACALANNGDYGGFTIATPSQSRSVAFLGSNGTAYIQTNNGSTALTLDSSQNATFAKKVGFTAQAAGTTLVDLSSTDDAKILGFGGNTFLRMGGNFTLEAGNEGFLSVLGNAIARLGASYFKLFQPLWLDNAYVAGAPTATGYVTIKDSNGTTYKVLVST